MDKTKIEWTDATWNPIAGCSKVSQGCARCYAIKDAHRLSNNTNSKIAAKYEGTVTPDGRNWTGRINFSEETLELPLRWKRPRRIFVNSMSDLFHESIPDAWIDRIFSVMFLAPQHTFQILTKRPSRMLSYMRGSLTTCGFKDRVTSIAGMIGNIAPFELGKRFPLTNVWLGVSVEDQQTADERIPLLLQTPAAVRWLSCEPLLGAIDCSHRFDRYRAIFAETLPPVNWVVVGGESGMNARPMHVAWARSIRDACIESDTNFLFKQWGEWTPYKFDAFRDTANDVSKQILLDANGTIYKKFSDVPHKRADFTDVMYRIGKKSAGRLLDGQTWDEYPDDYLRETALVAHASL